MFKDYIVQYEEINSSKVNFVHFVSEFPQGTFGFYEDLYDGVYSISDDDFRILSVEEGF